MITLKTTPIRAIETHFRKIRDPHAKRTKDHKTIDIFCCGKVRGDTLMNCYDLCLTWSWEYDADFVRLLESACQARGMSVLHVTPQTVTSVVAALETGQITFAVYLDRTEHASPYEPVFRWAREHGCYRINPKEAADRAEDKATMHFELIRAGLVTPYTIILPPYNEQISLPTIDLSPLGKCFVIKPSCGGGSEGVIIGATSLKDVLVRRKDFPHLKYLLQQTINFQNLDERKAWFRVIFCDGNIYSCWWDTQTHIYVPVITEEETRYGLSLLREITSRIATLCKLGFFSTEIVFSSENRWVVIDYVNDQIDMRLQSQARDGVPDAVVEKISFDLARLIEKHRDDYQVNMQYEIA